MMAIMGMRRVKCPFCQNKRISHEKLYLIADSTLKISGDEYEMER